MSVLEAMQPAAWRDPYYSTPLSEPVLTKPQGHAGAPPPGRNTSGPVSFPVTVRERSDSSDPGLEKSPHFQESVQHRQDLPQAIDPPLPVLKPVISAARDKTSLKTPPLPPRRPAIQHASSSFIEQAKKLAVTDLSMSKTAAMPAVPPRAVEKEALMPPPGAASDSLGKSLLAPSRQEMVDKVSAIEKFAASIAPAAKRAAPLPSVKPQASADGTSPKILDLTAIEPMAHTETASMIDITADYHMEETSNPRTSPETNPENNYVSLEFSQGSAEIAPDTITALEEKILPFLNKNPDLRVQIQAFASETDEALKGARRTSLSRALSIRSYLMDKGVEAQRMDVRALGAQTDRQPRDRVDFVFFSSTLNQ